MSSFSFPLSNFFDANGDNLTFNVTGIPNGSWVEFYPGNITFSGNPSIESIMKVTLTINDGWNGT